MSLATRLGALCALLVVAFCLNSANAGTILNTPPTMVAVGNPSNLADPANGHGAVAYSYKISATDVTVSQYVGFLNAVAKTDPDGLFNTTKDAFTQIVRSGASGSYTYAAATGDSGQPVARVSWWNAARYVNWLQNGLPTGAEGAATTETGVYNITAGQTTRNAAAKYALPTLNEWYKAAYYNPTASTYYTYPTASNTAPTSNAPGLVHNGANFMIGRAYASKTYYSDAGAYIYSRSPYGTYDQGGDVYQWTETGTGTTRDVVGGAYDTTVSSLSKSTAPLLDTITQSYADVGFRVVGLTVSGAGQQVVPEPATLALLALGGLPLLRAYARSRRRA